MHRLTSTWDRVFDKFRSKRSNKKRKGISPLKRRTFAMEPLEERTLLSVSPLGDETLLNTYTVGTQQLYDSGDAVAAMPDGGYVVSWTSDGQDGSGKGVYARRFDAEGAPTSDEFLVNSTTNWSQQRSSVAVDADGGFVVVWDSYGQDGILAGVFAQRYNALGQTVGGEFQVNETSFGHQSTPAVACLDDGGFVVVWSGQGNGDSWGVFGRRYDADGQADGGEFLINTATGNLQRSASVAALPNSGFVVAWQSHGGQDGSWTGVFAQRFDADCDPLGGEFQVNTTTDDHQINPAVAADAAGRFTVVWQSKGQDSGGGYGVFAQRFNADGAALGGEFQANTYVSNDQEYPSIAYNADGGFVVSWSGKGPGDSHGVFAREFDADGVALGDEVLVNATTSQWQQYATVANIDDEYVVVWSGKGTGDNQGVFMRRIGPSLSTSGIPSVSVAEDAADTTIDLSASFADPYHNPLAYQITDNTDSSLFDSVAIDGDQLTLDYAADVSGSAEITVLATNSLGEFVESSFTVNVAPMNDAPVVLSFDPINVAEDAPRMTLSLGDVFQDIDDWFYGLRFAIMSNSNPGLFTTLEINESSDALVFEFAPETSGTANIVLRATDEEGRWAEATVPITVSAVNDAPVAAPATAVLARQDANPSLLDLATLFSDVDDPIANLSYEIIANDNTSLVTTQLQGSQLTLSYLTGQTGSAMIVVRASDAAGHYDKSSYHTINVTVSPTNLAPQISGLLDAPDPGIEGATLHLTATGVIDDTAVTSVAYWRDADHNDSFDPAVDQLLGTDTDGSDGWQISVSSAGFGIGAQRYFAQATDEDSLPGNVATTTGFVGAVAVLDNSEAGYVETGAGWTDNASGGYLDTARRHEAGSGENSATWTFDGLMVKPHEVFITWQAESSLASNAQFSIYDGEELLGTFSVDQRIAPNDANEDGAGWLSLGEYTITNGQLTVVLTDAADGAVVADAVRLVDPPPTIEELTVTSTVDRPDDVTLTANNVADSDGTVVEVSFYRDTNGNSVYNSGVDELLGTDTNGGDGWSITADTITFETGTQTYFAVATDNDSLTSNVVWAQGVVEGLVAYGPTSVYEGNTYTLQLDPAGIAITSWSIDWDGDTVVDDIISGSLRSYTHVYADDTDGGTLTIIVTGTDGVDSYSANQFDVEVLNVAPYLSISGDATVAEGSQYTLNLSVDDPGADTITGWTIDWGDGGDPEYFSGNPSSVTHYYADGLDTHTITATADDEDGTAWPVGGVAGELDYSFGTDANTTTAFSTGVGVDYGRAMVVDANGKIIVIGYTGAHDVELARYNTDGTLDTSFGDGGRVVSDIGGYDVPTAVKLQSDGKIVVAGAIHNPLNGQWDTFLSRYHTDGTIDLSFGEGGRVITNLGGTDCGLSLAVDGDDRLIVAGYASSGDYEFAVARYTSDGRLDPSFSDDGMLRTDFDGYTDLGRAVVLQPYEDSYKIIVVGQSYNGSNYDFALAKYDEDGVLDTSFGGGDGKVTTSIGAGDDMAYAVAIYSEIIVVAGQSYNGSNYDFAVACYDIDNGNLDTSFITNGKTTFAVCSGDDEAYAIAVKSNGDILIAGRTHNGSNYDFAVACYDVSENDLDDNFDTDGIQTIFFGSGNDEAYDMVLLEGDDELLVAGTGYTNYSYDFAVARLHCDTGALDNTFDGDSGTGNGKVTTDFPSGQDLLMDIVVQEDQKTVAAGYAYVDGSYDFTLSRYNADGSLDDDFGTDGKQITNFSAGSSDVAYSIALQADQKIVVVGRAGSDFGVARYTTDGALDSSFDGDGLVTTTFGSSEYARAVAVQDDGYIVVAGYSNVNGTYDFAVARYTPSGSLDTSFDYGGNSDGKVLTPIGAGEDLAFALALQDDGKIIVAGRTYNGSDYDFALVRYNADGTLDEDFDGDYEQNPGNGIVTLDFDGGEDIINDVVVQSDGKIVVVGSAHDGSYIKFATVRFNADGSLDTTFGDDDSGIILEQIAGGYHSYARAVDIQTDGKIVVSGYSNSGAGDFAIVRYTDNGDLDTTFGSGGISTTDFGFSAEIGYTMALQSDDRIVVAGMGHYDFQLVRYLPGDVPTTVTVTNIAPTLSVSNRTVVVDCETTLTDIGTFTDPGFDTETYNYTINWGDGSDPDLGTATIDVYGEIGVSTEGSLDGSHEYASVDTYTVTVTLSDGDDQDVETFYVTVRDSAAYTWDGGGADDFWMTAENWSGDVAPLPGDQLYFTGISPETVENNFPDETVFESIEIASAAFELSGNSIILTDGITINAAATGSEIWNAIRFDGAITVDVATGATLTIYGELYGDGSLTKTGGGELVIAGPYSYTGGTTVSAGTTTYLAIDRDENVLEGSQLTIDLNPADFLIGIMQEPLTYSLETDPESLGTLLTFNPVYNRITWTPDTNWGGYCPTVCVTATDVTGNVSAAQTIFIDVYDRNRAPAFTGSLGTQQAIEGQAFTYDFSLSSNNYYVVDPDEADETKTPPGLSETLTYTLEDVDLAMYNGATGPTIDAETGEFSWMPSEAHGGGWYYFKVRATDEGGLSVLSNTITISVSEADVLPTISGPSSITVDNRTSASFRYTVNDPDGYSGYFLLPQGLPSEISIISTWDPLTCILQWNPSNTTVTGTYQFNLELYYNGPKILKPITLTVNEGNGTVPTGPFIWPNQVPWYIAWSDTAQQVTINFSSYNPETTETTTYTVIDWPEEVTQDPPTITQNGVLTWNIPAYPPTGVFPLTIGVSDDGSPSYSSQMEWWGQIAHDTTHFVANHDFVHTPESSGVYKVRVSRNDSWSYNTAPTLDSQPSHGTLSSFSLEYYIGSYYWTCDYIPTQGYYGVDSFTYSYPAEYSGGDLINGASNTATAYIAVEPVSVDLTVQGQYEGQFCPEAILPVNTGWEEQGVQGVSRIADNKNNGIVADIQDDSQLRSATVTLTNDYPCSVTGYWLLSIPYYSDGQWRDYLSSDKVRAYRDVSGTWTEMFACEEIPVTIGAGQSVAVSLALEGLAQPPGNLRAFFQVIRIHDDTLQGGFAFQQGLEYGNPQDIADTYCCAFDDVHLTIAEVDLRVGTLTMPDVYEDDLPSVVPMNRDYDEGRFDGEYNPLPDCTPGVTTLPNANDDDELVSGWVSLPWPSNAKWTMIIPPELRVWRWDQPLQTWWLVESGESYSASVSGGSFNIKVEGLAPSGVPPYLTVSCQKTDAEGSPLGTAVSDRVLVEVVSIDLEVAEISELDEETQPAFVPLNDDYDEVNIHIISGDEVADNNRLFDQLVSVTPRIDASDDDLVCATLTIDGPNGQTGRYWIEVLNEPVWLQYPDWPGYSQYIRIWQYDGVEVPRDEANALPITLDEELDLLIEGLAEYYNPINPIKLIAHFIPDGSYSAAGVFPDVTDETLAQVVQYKVDLDIDSNNNGSIDPQNGPPGEDDPIEEELPGKIVCLNKDDDNGNGVPDREEAYGATVVGEDDLAEIKLHALVDAAIGDVEDWKVTLEAGSADLARIRLYDSHQKSTPLEWTLSDDVYTISFDLDANGLLNETLWVEGIDTGGVFLQLFIINEELGSERIDDIILTVLELQQLTVDDYNNPTNVATAADRTPEDMFIVQDELTATIDVLTYFDPATHGDYGTGQFVHVTIARSDGLSVLDTTCYETRFFWAQSLVATDTARDFTVTVWVDLNSNDAVDANEDHRIVVVHIVNVKLYTIDYDATDSHRYHVITRDPTVADPAGVAYGDIEWQDENLDGDAEDEAAGDHLYPVCYTRSGTPYGDVKIRADIEIRVLGNPGSDLKVRASGMIGGQNIDLIEATPNAHLVGGTHIQATLESVQAIPDTILYNTVDLDWQVSFDDGVTWYDVGTSNNTSYFTWDDPNSGALYETCVYIGCSAADGRGGTDGTNDIDALNEIWTNGFTSCSVQRVDGTPLKYYNPWDTDNYETAKLLIDANGQCGSWAHLFIDVLKAQGIYTNYSNSSAPSYYHDYVFVIPESGYAQGFIVKNWTFTTDPGISGLPEYPYLNIPDSPLINGNSYDWLFAQVTDQNGIPGQNSPNPASLFNNHQIVRVISKDAHGNNVETFYDPSYGATYTDLDNMEQTSIDGYFISGLLDVNEVAVGLDLDHDGHIDNKTVNVVVYAFRKNTNGGHLIENTSVPPVWRTY